MKKQEKLNEALIEAAKSGGNVAAFLKAGARVNTQDFITGYTALHHAALKGDAQTVDLLIAAGANVSVGNPVDYDNTPLHYAAGWQKYPANIQFHSPEERKKVLQALVKAGDTLELRNRLSYTPFISVVAYGGDVMVIQELIAIGANINSKCDSGSNVLHYALENPKDAPLLKMLVDAGADVNATCEYNATPLHTAAYLHHADMVEILLSGGARWDICDNGGRTPLERTQDNLGDGEEQRKTIALLEQAQKGILPQVPEHKVEPIIHTMRHERLKAALERRDKYACEPEEYGRTDTRRGLS